MTKQSVAFTHGEWRVLAEVAEGKTNKEIARMFDVTERQIQRHLTNIFRKLGCSTRTEAARWYWRNGRGGA